MYNGVCRPGSVSSNYAAVHSALRKVFYTKYTLSTKTYKHKVHNVYKYALLWWIAQKSPATYIEHCTVLHKTALYSFFLKSSQNTSWSFDDNTIPIQYHHQCSNYSWCARPIDSLIIDQHRNHHQLENHYTPSPSPSSPFHHHQHLTTIIINNIIKTTLSSPPPHHQKHSLE